MEGPPRLRRLSWPGIAASVGLACVRVTSPLRAQIRLETHLGTFLTRDRGWNWELNVSGRLGLASQLSRDWWAVGDVAGRLSACPCGTYPSIPPPPESIANGLGVGYEVQRRMLDQRVSGLLGVEWFHVLEEQQARGSTLAGNMGIGWYWGRQRTWGMELRSEGRPPLRCGRLLLDAAQLSYTLGHPCTQTTDESFGKECPLSFGW